MESMDDPGLCHRWSYEGPLFGILQPRYLALPANQPLLSVRHSIPPVSISVFLGLWGVVRFLLDNQSLFFHLLTLTPSPPRLHRMPIHDHTTSRI